MKCPNCGKETIERIDWFRDVAQVIQDYCPSCGESYTTALEISRAEKIYNIILKKLLSVEQKRKTRQ